MTQKRMRRDTTPIKSERFLKILEGKELTFQQVYNQVGCNEKTARKYLNKLVEIGKINVREVGGEFKPIRLYSIKKGD